MKSSEKRVSLTVRVSEDMHRDLKLYALRKGKTIQEYILGLINADIAQDQMKEQEKRQEVNVFG